MNPIRRSLCWFLAVVLLCTLAVIVTAEPGAVDPTLVTTPSTTQPVIAHIEVTP